MNTPDYFVLYADMLGFKRLVLRHKVPYPEHLDYRDRAIGHTLGSMLMYGNPLGEAFKAFHGGIELLINQINWTTQVSLVVFSDSLFLATTAGKDCMGFAEQMMTYTIGQETPMRMGVGYGSFVPYGLAFEESPRVKLFSSQFFGSGVIYAVAAEKQLKGLRIALHRSAADVLSQPAADMYDLQHLPEQVLPLPAAEASEYISHEWNYLHRANDYTMAVDPTARTEAERVNATLVGHVETMLTKSPNEEEKIAKLYADTKAANQRMLDSLAAVYAAAEARPDNQ